MHDSWRIMRLGDAAQVRIGRQRAPRHATGDNLVPYLRAANVKDRRLDLSDIKLMNFTPDEQQTFALEAGDVLDHRGMRQPQPAWSFCSMERRSL